MQLELQTLRHLSVQRVAAVRALPMGALGVMMRNGHVTVDHVAQTVVITAGGEARRGDLEDFQEQQRRANEADKQRAVENERLRRAAVAAPLHVR